MTRPSVRHAAIVDRRLHRWGRRISDVAGYCYSGSVKLVQFPAYAFDLLDRHGKPDHSKIGPFLVSQELVAISFYDVVRNGHPLQTAIVLIIAVLSFASASLMRYFVSRQRTEILASSSADVSVERRDEHVTIDETMRVIQERRDPAAGFEAT